MSQNYIELRNSRQIHSIDLGQLKENLFWKNGDVKELKRHKIHAYPAKFPAFITTKALAYAQEQGLDVQRVADIFCGCGTVAFEAKRNGIAFWGCDLNPVATLIAKVKSHSYASTWLCKYAEQIIAAYAIASDEVDFEASARERLNYWYSTEQFHNLAKLLNSILGCISTRSPYRAFFLCAFSNILKPTSRWLTKSIKPQIDPIKVPSQVLHAFNEQVKNMIEAMRESETDNTIETQIVNGNFLSVTPTGQPLDMIITSPPYVTSYEYADLHQLSSLWLGYTDDYRKLRTGSIGSSQTNFDFTREVKRLNEIGSQIVFRLFDLDKAIARSTAKYFLDMQNVSNRCHRILQNNGIALFVIGNTEYKGVRVDNAKHLAEALLTSGFVSVKVTKRKISNKFLTPYRDGKGKFTRASEGRKVYAEEFILIAQK